MTAAKVEDLHLCKIGMVLGQALRTVNLVEATHEEAVATHAQISSEEEEKVGDHLIQLVDQGVLKEVARVVQVAQGQMMANGVEGVDVNSRAAVGGIQILALVCLRVAMAATTM